MVLKSLNPSFRVRSTPSTTSSNMERKSSVNKAMSANDDRAQLVKPTEAQLKWAQFHHKRRAKQVRQNVQRMWQTPQHVSDVDGATSDDGVTTDEGSVSSTDSGAKMIRKQKPTISRGRRAMLRVSKRAYLQRREIILREGFQCCGDKENEEDDAVSDLVNMEGAKKQRRKRQSRIGGMTSSEEADRAKRFEDAFSMLMSLKPKQQPRIVASSRRWTRPKNAKETGSVNYSDWKLGLARRKRAAALKNSRHHSSDMPFDRRASWLVHLPTRESVSRKYVFNQAVASDGTPLEPLVGSSSH